MPVKPARPCTQPGCAELITVGSKCETHKKETAKGYDRFRGSRQSRGYNSEWEKLRLKALKRDGYICRCEDCAASGRMIPATHVDHRVAFTSMADPLRLDLDNLVSMSMPCHARKTVKYDGGLGKVKKRH